MGNLFNSTCGLFFWLFSAQGDFQHAVFLASITSKRFAGDSKYTLGTSLAPLRQSLLLFNNDCALSATTWSQLYQHVYKGEFVSRETLIMQREGIVSRETSGEEIAFLKKLFGKGFFLISASQAPMML